MVPSLVVCLDYRTIFSSSPEWNGYFKVVTQTDESYGASLSPSGSFNNNNATILFERAEFGDFDARGEETRESI